MKSALASGVALSLLVTALSSCASQGVTTDYVYSELARSAHLDLKSDGYLIGVEKRPRNKVHGPSRKSFAGLQYRLLPEDQSLPQQLRKQNHKRNHEFRHVTGDGEICLVTHVASFFKDRREFLYNAYADRLPGDDPGPPLADQKKLDVQAGYHALDVLEQDLNQRLAAAEESGHPYTHLLVISMGWHNAQLESIWRYNRIIANLRTVAKQEKRVFRPLVIGFTWPSAWYGLADSRIQEKVGHIGSYFNKANDADEIGYTLANIVVNRIARGAKAGAASREQALRLVVIGHSFGARLLSRALFSEAHLVPKEQQAPLPDADLFIGLQGAVSILRFSKGTGREGSPYAEFADRKTAIVLTASKEDKANPAARIFTRARNVGSRYGIAWAQKHDDFEVFYAKAGFGEPWRQAMTKVPSHVLMIDATGIITEHNDILKESQAQLIWHILDAFAPSPAQDGPS